MVQGVDIERSIERPVFFSGIVKPLERTIFKLQIDSLPDTNPAFGCVVHVVVHEGVQTNREQPILLDRVEHARVVKFDEAIRQ